MKIYFPFSSLVLPDTLYDLRRLPSIFSNRLGKKNSRIFLDKSKRGVIFIIPINIQDNTMTAENTLAHTTVMPTPIIRPTRSATYENGNKCSNILEITGIF